MDADAKTPPYKDVISLVISDENFSILECAGSVKTEEI
jgi:hypothetical protein